jgi:glyoxylase I family protein
MQLEAIHHIILTVSNIERSRAFYTEVLGFKVALEVTPTRLSMHNGKFALGISEPLDRTAMPVNDCFNEHRLGLDHLSFAVESYDKLEAAAKDLDERGISRGEIHDLSPHGLPVYVMAFRDPDNIQLELTAPAK